MAKNQILVLGGGYTGIVTAARLARLVRADDASVTLVTEHATRDERMRWHQLAAGESYPLLPIGQALEGTGAALKVAHIERINLAARTVDTSGGERLPYDALVIALGSVIDFGSVPGARENAQGLTDVTSIADTAKRVDAAPDGARITVVGGGLTGIELATELAEAHPRLNVAMVSSRDPGDWLSEPARKHLAKTLDRLGIERITGRVARIDEGAVALAGGRSIPSSVTFWAGGFRANPLVEAAGLEVDELGRARVDETFRAISHPEVWVLGDAARVAGRDGEPLKMGCRTGAFMAIGAPQRIARELTGVTADAYVGRYFAECISLGRHDALVQWLTPEGAPTARITTGRAAVAIKEFIHRGNQLVPRHPGPYLPGRRAHVPTTTDGHREKIDA